MTAITRAFSLLVSLSLVLASRPHASFRPLGAPLVRNPAISAVVTRNGTVFPPYNTTHYFDQLIDHTDPQSGTFRQRYWHTYEFYEPGGPIILMTPGETNAEGYVGYLTNATINGLIAQQQNGATIILEHRFFGLSNPYPDLSVKSFRVHTVQQAIDDLEYFARNVKLPMLNGDNLGPDKAPWILIGASYSGALTSWTMVNKPGLFWAGYASSAIVEATFNFWEYFEPIRQNMPANCSADVQKVIAHVDSVLLSDNITAIDILKASFGLGELKHSDDFANALTTGVTGWQMLQPITAPGAQFFRFCDALEVSGNVIAPAAGFGLEHALNAWSSYFSDSFVLEICAGLTNEACFGTYDANATSYTSTAVDDWYRSWNWLVCNELGYFRESPPLGKPAIVSRVLDPSYDLRICQLTFPEAFPTPRIPSIKRTNILYEGWHVKLERIFFANGIRDPWRDATVSAEGLHLKSSPKMPIALGDGFHGSDLVYAYALVDPSIAAIQTEALQYMKTWLATWKPSTQSYN
ncbi:serine carboxypeptidase S28-domain-containing protein [Mycena floridula]|nr:serine carboxypeptidase S28-domain-containing protein [Mycena floridula]